MSQGALQGRLHLHVGELGDGKVQVLQRLFPPARIGIKLAKVEIPFSARPYSRSHRAQASAPSPYRRQRPTIGVLTQPSSYGVLKFHVNLKELIFHLPSTLMYSISYLPWPQMARLTPVGSSR